MGVLLAGCQVRRKDHLGPQPSWNVVITILSQAQDMEKAHGHTRGGGAWSLCIGAMGVIPGRRTKKKATSQKEKVESEEVEHHPELHENICGCSCDQRCAVNGCGSTGQLHGAQVCLCAKGLMEEKHHPWE